MNKISLTFFPYHLNTASGVHSGVITEDLDEVDGGRIKIGSLHGDSRHESAAIGGLSNNEDTTTPLGRMVNVVYFLLTSR